MKLFENKILDDILDKISKYGKETLTPLELKLLNSYSNKEDTYELEEEYKKKRNVVDSLFSYDPREDAEFYDELSRVSGVPFNWADTSQEEIDEGRYEILWDTLSLEDIEHFMQYFSLKHEINELPWNKLDNSIKQKFIKYINEIY